MKYCDAHQDLSAEEGDGCPLCECMQQHEAELARWTEMYERQKNEIAVLERQEMDLDQIDREIAEVWKQIPNYSGYEVSNYGSVRSWRNG